MDINGISFADVSHQPLERFVDTYPVADFLTKDGKIERLYFLMREKLYSTKECPSEKITPELENKLKSDGVVFYKAKVFLTKMAKSL